MQELKTISPSQAAVTEEQGCCVLRIGEVVEVKGGRFRVAAIGRRFVRLEGLPGERLLREEDE